MKKLHRIKWIGFLTVLLVLLSCSAEDGEDGAIGPQGPQGEQGPVGAQGEQGEQGEQGPPGTDGQDGADGTDGTDGADGNANVIYSDWITVEPSAWAPPLGTATSLHNTTIMAPELTQEDLDTSVILVYLNLVFIGGANAVAPLPWNDERAEFAISRLAIGEIILKLRSLDGEAFIVNPPIAFEFRYVIIPGGNPTSGKSPYPDFTKMTYNEVVAYFNIK